MLFREWRLSHMDDSEPGDAELGGPGELGNSHGRRR